MDTPSTTPVCILAGGASQRFGEDKALALLHGRPLLAHVLERVAGQTSGPIAINAGSAEALATFELPVLEDSAWQGSGPLAGVYTAMEWAARAGFETVVTLAVDLPFAPLDLVSKLEGAGAPAIAATKDRWHPVNGVWRADQLEALHECLRSGKRSAHGWAEHCGARIALFEEGPDGLDPFWNINTREDMKRAQRHARPI